MTQSIDLGTFFEEHAKLKQLAEEKTKAFYDEQRKSEALARQVRELASIENERDAALLGLDEANSRAEGWRIAKEETVRELSDANRLVADFQVELADLRSLRAADKLERDNLLDDAAKRNAELTELRKFKKTATGELERLGKLEGLVRELKAITGSLFGQV